MVKTIFEHNNILLRMNNGQKGQKYITVSYGCRRKISFNFAWKFVFQFILRTVKAENQLIITYLYV